jgi:hypothetical protein
VGARHRSSPGTLLARYRVKYVVLGLMEKPGNAFKAEGYRVCLKRGTYTLWQSPTGTYEPSPPNEDVLHLSLPCLPIFLRSRNPRSAAIPRESGCRCVNRSWCPFVSPANWQ